MVQQPTLTEHDRKTCVITGATSGIGLETAKRLGALGARLVLVGRNRHKGTAAIVRLRAKLPGLNVEMHQALLRERLIVSAPSVVNVASEAHRGSHLDFEDLQCSRRYSGWRAYQRSKLANILFTCELARRLEGTGVTANCLHPGFVATSFGDNNRGFWGLGIAIAKMISAIPVQRGAETPVYLASAPDLDGVSGKCFIQCRERQPDVQAQNDETAARLWKESERLMAL